MEDNNNLEYRSKLIKDYDKDERPREKALAHGIESLTNAELMALIFSTGIKGKSVIDLCKEILEANGNSIDSITRLSVQGMCHRFRGIGVAKAVTLLAGIELGKRAAQEKSSALGADPLRDSNSAYHHMRSQLQGLDHEEFWVVLISRAGKPITRVQISRGGTAATTVDVKLIMRAALTHLASSMILYHNHPSGTLRPSPEDDRITKKIADAAQLFDIRVNDHIIITDTSYYSYADNGRI